MAHQDSNNHILITDTYKLNAIVETLKSVTNNSFFLFCAKTQPYEDSDTNIETPNDSEDYLTKIYRDIIFGKKINPATDVVVVAKKNVWVAGTVYTQYDSSVADLANYYVMVHDSSFTYVYKCLFNNYNAKSTIQPDISLVSPGDNFFETSDGYIWKYIYKVPDIITSMFATDEYFPIIIDPSVVASAINGSIDVILVENQGNNYSNYLAGSNKFTSGDMRLNGNNLLYNISGNVVASTSNDYYNDCYIYIKTGPTDEVGQYRRIVDYQVNSSSKTIVLESAFTNVISSSITYDIYPGVTIIGDGQQTINAQARAIVNSVSNTIYKIDMLNVGANYQVANAFIYTYPDVGASGADLRVVYSPRGGHGADPYAEFRSPAFLLRINVNSDENGTIIANNDYRTIGLIKNPLFANVDIKIANVNGTFLNGEIAYKITPIYLSNTGVLNTSNNLFTTMNGDLRSQFKANDFIYIASGNNHMLGVVNNVVNASALYLKNNGFFNSNNANYYIPSVSTTGVVTGSNNSSVTLTSVRGSIESGNMVIGRNSGALVTANSVYISGINKPFNTFLNTYKYKGTILSGEFENDEVVYQPSVPGANAILYAAQNDTLYTVNQFGTFNINETIVGRDSDAVSLINEKNVPDLVFRSGEILYIENLAPITRHAGQSETFKLIFEY